MVMGRVKILCNFWRDQQDNGPIEKSSTHVQYELGQKKEKATQLNYKTSNFFWVEPNQVPNCGLNLRGAQGIEFNHARSDLGCLTSTSHLT